MRALLDTHTFLWWNLSDPRLSQRAHDFIWDGQNKIYLSAVTAWEIAIKASIGRLALPEQPSYFVANRMKRHDFNGLPIEISHALHVYELPDIHKDPFDRLLIAQSKMEKMPILTQDSEITLYDIDVIW